MRAAARRLLPVRTRGFLRRVERAAPYFGLRYRCPFCRLRFRKLCPRGRDLPVYAEQGVIGGGYRRTECPWCRSNDRERLLYLYLRRHTDLFRTPRHVLHIAPEERLRRAILRTAQLEYTTGDLRMSGVDRRLDLTSLPIPDEAYDVIICSHVLEHVHDDRAAMSELRRVLAPAGWAVLQVPIASLAERTEEEVPSHPLTPDERSELFGDPSHVRLYAEGDYVRRLDEAGFSVRSDDALHLLGERAVSRYCLTPGEKIFLCTPA